MKEFTIEEKAALWDALMSCQRFHTIGWATRDGKVSHLGIEMWDKYPGLPPNEDEFSRNKLIGFVQSLLPNATVEVCPDCGRGVAKNFEDCAMGLCPKTFAFRDGDAENDCKRVTSERRKKEKTS